MADATDTEAPHIGWVRAILTTAAIAVVGVAVLVYVPNAVLTKVHSLSRGSRVGVAATIFFVGLFALAWMLRQLQRRRLI
jgi:hypothetical protein